MVGIGRTLRIGKLDPPVMGMASAGGQGEVGACGKILLDGIGGCSFARSMEGRSWGRNALVALGIMAIP